MTTIAPVLFILLGVLAFGLIWLLPLHWVCQYAKRERKNHNIVMLVGFFTSWVVALIVALLLPTLDVAALAALNKKEERQPLGETGIILAGIGVCSLIVIGFMVFVSRL